jgi:predicted DNA-binding protein (MmcQ/YjbR family)
MNIEADIFKKSKFDENKLIKYGFTKNKNKFTFCKNIMNDSFRVEIYIEDNNVKSKIIDLSFDEEYIAYKIEEQTGEFVSSVRNELKNILLDIKNNCTISNSFIFDQTNRITKFINEKYHDNPLFLWEDNDAGVFKNKRNGKWYGIIMSVDRSKLDKTKSGIVEVINLKLDDMVESLLEYPGYYQAYHMNKKSWITIILDDTIDDEIIKTLIMDSYNIVNRK